MKINVELTDDQVKKISKAAEMKGSSYGVADRNDADCLLAKPRWELFRTAGERPHSDGVTLEYRREAHRIPGKKTPGGFRAGGNGLDLMLTVRSDLNAIINAIDLGKTRHARALAEYLLAHVDETIEEE